jgi:hypothetical protein
MAVMQSRADREAKNPHWILARIMYSPDLNPIEMPYSKFKAHMRKLAERTGEGVRRAIRSFLPSLGGARMRGMQAMLPYDRNPL